MTVVSRAGGGGSRGGDIFELRKSHDKLAGITGIYTRDLRSRSQVSPPRDPPPPA